MIRKIAWGSILTVALAMVTAVPAAAQSEASLKAAFEGRYIVVRMDMPASKMGVDISVNKAQKLKHKENDQRVRRQGVAFENGEAARITEIRVKKKYIEILLEGGGYGVKGDEKKRNYRAREVEMSQEEENLREELRYLTTSHPQTKMLVQATIAHLEAEREAEYHQLVEEARARQDDQNARVSEKRLAGGARFNVRFGKKIPANALTPEGLMALLDGYVDFSPEAVEAGQRQREQRENSRGSRGGDSN